jgi:DNA-binding SARP family transcriptional activator
VRTPRARRVEARSVTLGILGPVEAHADGRTVVLGSAKQRALLAVLAIHANETISSDRLIEELWGAEPPSTAPKMVQVLVSRLRRALEPSVGDPQLLLTRPLGYALVVTPEQVDLTRFDAAVAAARRLAPTDPSRAADALRDALAIWRGAPLSDVAREPFAAWAIPRLDELRLGVVEERIDLDLRAGRHAEVVAELRDLMSRHPFRERVAAQLMLALYRTGRQADALETYHEIRLRLRRDLGIDPGTDLQRLQGAILQQDPELNRSSATVAMPPPGATTEVASPAQRSGRRLPSRFVRVTGLALVAAIAGIAALASYWRVPIGAPGSSGGPGPIAAQDSVAILDAATNELVADVPAGNAPSAIAASGGDVWVGMSTDHTVVRIDVASHRVLHTTGLTAAPATLVASDGNLWIGNGFNGTLSHVLAAYDQLTGPFFPGASISGLLAMAAGNGDLWVGLSDGTLLQLEASSLRVKRTVSMPARILAIALAHDAAWTIQFRDDLVRRVDAIDGTVTPGIEVDGTPAAIAFGAGSVWVATGRTNRVWQIDPVQDRLVTSYPVAFSPSAIAPGPDGVWVLDAPHGLLERLDPTGRALPITLSLGRPVGGMILVGDELWLTIR